MDKFVVSARKYRPKLFQDVVGQLGVTETLRNALKSKHVAQSFLFCGPRGVGKTTCARILAKAINCAKPDENFEPCGKCASCMSFDQSASFNIYELDAASNNSVNDIRDLVDQVRVPPQGAKFKVYIIDEVHMLSTQAFNAFLKTLEEPPAYAVFILATTEKHKILPTILSRCQIYDFNRINISDMADHLEAISNKEAIKAEKSALMLIAKKADGALRDALSLFDRLTDHIHQTLSLESVLTNLNILDYDYYFQFTESFLTQNITDALLLIHQVENKGFDGDLLLNGLMEHFRNLLVAKDLRTAQLIDADEELKQRYLAQSEIVSADFLINAMNIVSQYELQYKSSKNKRILLELCFLKLTQLNSLFEVVHVPNIESIDKKKNSNPNAIEQTTAIELKKKEPEELPLSSPPKQTVENSQKTNEALPETAKATKPLKLITGAPISKITLSQSSQTKAVATEELLRLDQHQLTQLWVAFTDQLQDTHPHISALRDILIPSLEQQTHIIFRVDSGTIAGQLDGLKEDWIAFLKLHKIEGAIVQIVLEENKNSSKPLIKKNFSDKEKIDAMRQENKHLKTLIEKLNLKFT